MNFLFKIKKGETPAYAKIKKFILSLYKINIPFNKTLGKLLYNIRLTVLNILKIIKNKLWDIPVFKSICKTYGRNLILYHGIPQVTGDLEITIGNDVSFYKSEIEAKRKGSVCPYLKIGNNVVVGPGTIIKIKKSISIGNDCLIGANNLIMDYYDFKDENFSADNNEGNSFFVEIKENVWTGRNVSILKGVTIGKNSIISANSLVIEDVPENVIAMGVPAKVVMRNIDKFYRV
ncbi:MAG TPA: acyltransferase [Spirochaetota bacterium]|nr:acyltransferase [Spirochaetota bacterium]HPR47788.1 acyltransferase [Spirochaetota bacterium]